MSWISKTFSSSIGRKIIMAVTGLFLCSFLVVHLVGNLQLFKADNGVAFNAYSEFMGHNPIIRTLEIVLVLGFGFHIYEGLSLAIKNRSARGSQGYVSNHIEQNSSWHSRSMAMLGSIVLFFLVVHLYNFFGSLRFGDVPRDANGNEDAYTLVLDAFKNPFYVALYVVAQFALLYHLLHGFSSAFQTLGLTHRKYTPAIKFVGYAFSIVVCAAFAAMPVYFFFFK
ncbi:succinate dehydrogenase cytochrome b subunit [Hymenobacter swuensis]|uniref:Succinate dehydrogenase (Or fumarate reductase) cytochrome b subunit n=1 Tax=Hymenobacter swuensis DY53 TaxID=1227739 RepID=W8F2H1_9BACT|nr:succinate dehydrogenase cytochrome b subunit [Hymenobacter swuensis]AHJ96786.1 succinate dehydrogenase (or fumarate reductase) cytochrome b subunit [Hymenobacter swuensis DY53]